MKIYSFYVCLFSLLIANPWFSLHALKSQKQHNHRKKKIVGYIQVRNEEIIVEQAVRCLARVVDAIVVLDDASTDKTKDILRTLQNELPIVEIIFNTESAWVAGKESDNQQRLLEAARKAGGTHFIYIDADEIISSNCLVDNYLRNEILKLKPGEQLDLCMIHLWCSPHEYRVDKSGYGPQGANFSAIFCDSRKLSYNHAFVHGSRLPAPLKKKKHKLPPEYVVLHYSFADWNNVLIKRSWYRCLELVKGLDTADSINRRYQLSPVGDDVLLDAIKPEWISAYENFDFSVYSIPCCWRKDEVNKWFDQYGKDFFKDLDIWEVDWENINAS